MLKSKCLKNFIDRCQLLERRCFSKKMKKDAKDPKKYTSTIYLPKTDFQVWIKPAQRTELDAHVQKVCNFSELYSWQRKNINGEEYVLHDGPPYANGLPHMGHAINKILKDITIRFKLLQGHKIHYKPGWDCHGLPIELLATSKLDQVENKLSPIDIREKARKFANYAINNQRAIFKSWCVMADWSDDGCYFSFDKDYIKNELLQFFNLYEKGFVYRDFKPVYWSPSSKTALAEAELEYHPDHISTAVTIAVKLTNIKDSLKNVIKKSSSNSNSDDLFAMLWTTTPWTLPANQAIAFNPSLDYSIIKVANDDKKYILATKLIPEFAKLIKKPCDIVAPISVEDLSSLKYEHPLQNVSDGALPFVQSNHVTSDKGTGLVHTACAHGQDDFLIGRKNGFKIESIVDEEGKYTDKAGDKLVGTFVLTEDCTNKVLSLINKDCILNVEKFQHSYPYDWRTNKPVILRASQQWFIDTDHLKQKAMEALKNVKIVPEKNVSGFFNMVQKRPYWCISRQRVWGVPIPILYNKSNGSPIISRSLLEHYCKLLDSHGSNFWWELPVSDIVPKNIASQLKLNLDDIEKGKDILDIWLDSGLSWSSVLGEDKVADMYLEGIDQFTGWFQSSLITSIALRGKSPYKSVFAHGFAVDDRGFKMSKSVGNVIDPQELIHGGKDKIKQKPLGIDVLRWWVAGHATQNTNVIVGKTLLTDSQQCVQKLRSVLRFLLGAIHDIESVFKPNENTIVLRTLDKYFLHLLYNFYHEVDNLYELHQYNKVCISVVNFITNEVSALYLLLTKDRLYCDDEYSNERRAVQVAMNSALKVILHVIAPIVPVLAEEVYMHHPMNKGDHTLFQTSYNVCDPSWNQPEVEKVMKLALDVRKRVIKESPNNVKNLCNLSGIVTLNPTSYDILKVLQNVETNHNSELAELFQLASVTLIKDSNLTDKSDDEYNYEVRIKSVAGDLCGRCRRYIATLHDGDSDICDRCSDVLSKIASREKCKTESVV